MGCDKGCQNENSAATESRGGSDAFSEGAAVAPSLGTADAAAPKPRY
jgi:hypothetical protein